MAKVLQHPEMGGFAEADIEKLENPDPQKMHEAIERLFSDRSKDGLIALYFSGHGIKDENGKLHLNGLHLGLLLFLVPHSYFFLSLLDAYYFIEKN